MEFLSGHVLTLANSIIGVSILAMPYCFKQCGVILSILILLISSIISRLACHFLLKSAILARRKTFEFLAFHIFGSVGKLVIELSIIGFLLGNCIAFFVIMGDLGPDIISEISGSHTGSTMRNVFLIMMAVFLVLPLGLLRNVQSLESVSKATVAFYFCLVTKIAFQALPHILKGDWTAEVELWRPAGILQCLPIFSMALFCQTQIFEIYEILPNASLEKMNSLIRVAVNICTCVYILVGTFGYISFYKVPFTGNILSSFVPSFVANALKMGFVLSIVFSFPVVIFPCRASLYSLFYKEGYTHLHEGAPSNYIPEGKFKSLTLLIVVVSLVIGILIPNIELVLGLVGSTIGVMICVLFPVTCFICISPKNTNERILAQIMLFVGVLVMVLGTYANLYAYEETQIESSSVEKISGIHPKIILSQPKESADIVIEAAPTTLRISKHVEKIIEEKIIAPPTQKPEVVEEKAKEVRHEPPQPEEPPVDSKLVKATEKPVPIAANINQPDSNKPDPIKVAAEVEKAVEIKPPESPKLPTKKVEEVDIEAIKKEEIELKEQEKLDPNKVLIETIQKKQNEFQKELVEQQKKLDEVIQQGEKKNDIAQVNEAKLKAVRSIESIAKEAIEKISGQAKVANSSGPILNSTNQLTNKTGLINNTRPNLAPLPVIRNQINLTEEKIQPQKVEPKAVEQPVEAPKDETRRKREVDEQNIAKLTEIIKQSCKDLKQQTEKPVLDMLCQLSNPALSNANLNSLQKQGAS